MRAEYKELKMKHFYLVLLCLISSWCFA